MLRIRQIYDVTMSVNQQAVAQVQEGGYKNNVIGINARNFFKGLWSGIHG